MRMKLLTNWVGLMLLISGATSSAHCESTYSRPYLGEWPGFASRFSGEYLREQAETGIPQRVREADLILLGEALELRENRDPNGSIETYDGLIRINEILKGRTDRVALQLRFKPSATGIDKGARHVFFLVLSDDGHPEVTDAWYLFPPRYNRMRVVGDYDCSREVGIGFLRLLATGSTPPEFAERLHGEYRSEEWGKRYSAVVMASFVEPEIGGDVLRAVVTGTADDPLNRELFPTAAYALAAGEGDRGLRALLEALPRADNTGRISESIVFDLVATLGTQELIPDILKIGQLHDEFAVSAAFALAGVGGDPACHAIETLHAESLRTGRSETIEAVSRPAATLLDQALQECRRP